MASVGLVWCISLPVLSLWSNHIWACHVAEFCQVGMVCFALPRSFCGLSVLMCAVPFVLLLVFSVLFLSSVCVLCLAAHLRQWAVDVFEAVQRPFCIAHAPTSPVCLPARAPFRSCILLCVCPRPHVLHVPERVVVGVCLSVRPSGWLAGPVCTRWGRKRVPCSSVIIGFVASNLVVSLPCACVVFVLDCSYL